MEYLWEGAHVFGSFFLMVGMNRELIFARHDVIHNLDKVGGVYRPPSGAPHIEARNGKLEAKFVDVVLFVVNYTLISRSWTLPLWMILRNLILDP